MMVLNLTCLQKISNPKKETEINKTKRELNRSSVLMVCRGKFWC